MCVKEEESNGEIEGFGRDGRCVRQTEQEQNRANKLLCPQLGGMGDGWKES